MGRGSSKAGGGVNSERFFHENMSYQVNYFRSVVPPSIEPAFQAYVYGGKGGTNKAQYDEENGLSEFIDSKAANALRVTDNPTLYRGGTITDEQFQSLAVGKTLDIMDSQSNLTSWSTREMVAHMYAEDSKTLWGQGGGKPHDVVIVDASKTSDGIVYPYSSPQNEVLRSRSHNYVVTKIVSENDYKGPIGRAHDNANYYTNPVTYIYVKSQRTRK